MTITIDQVREAILFLIALVLSITVHEFGHAWAANRLGDGVPKAQGRLSLSPARHVDPIGTLLFPLIMQLTHVPLLGWGRPVQTDPRNYTKRVTPMTGQMLVALAGPTMNLLMAAAVSLLVVAGARSGVLSGRAGVSLIEHVVVLNLSLMFFNLLPIPPLDGGAVLAWVLPASFRPMLNFMARWGFLILVGLMMTPFLRILMYPAYVVMAFWIEGVMRMAGMGMAAA